MADAEQAGIARDVAVAVLTDLLEGPDFNAESDPGRALVEKVAPPRA